MKPTYDYKPEYIIPARHHRGGVFECAGVTLRQQVLKTLTTHIQACLHCLEVCVAANNEHGAKRHRERLAEYQHRLACFLGQ